MTKTQLLAGAFAAAQILSSTGEVILPDRIDAPEGVKVTIAPDGAVNVRSASGEVDEVSLFWTRPIPENTRVFCDNWERTTGNAGWVARKDNHGSAWYTMINRGGCIEGWGVMTQPNAFAWWETLPEGLKLTIDMRAASEPTKLGDRTLEAVKLVMRRSRLGESTFAAGRDFCRMMCPRPRLPKEPVYGYNDWYCAYGNQTATNFLADAGFIVSLCKGLENRPFVMMDDGWQPNSPPVVSTYTSNGPGGSGYGPWTNSGAHFGMEMPEFCRRVADLGAKPGLWYRPFRAWAEVEEGLRLKNSRYYFDPSLPSVRKMVYDDVARFRSWGIKMVKIDYLTFDVTHKWEMQSRPFSTNVTWADRSRTSVEVLKDLYGAMREAAGDDMLILGCNALNHLAAGLFEVQRIGGDTSGWYWWVTRRSGISSLTARATQHGTFFSADADCVGLAREGAIPWELNRAWLELVARSGTPLFVSWKRDLATPEVREALSRAYAIAAKPRVTGEPLDAMENQRAVHWRFADGVKTFCWDYDWENPAVNSRNRLPPHVYTIPLANEKDALTDALEPESPYVKSLNGDWKFSWAGNPDGRIKEFFKSDYDDTEWDTIDVPSCVEMRGYGNPGYTNQRYPHANKPPYILDRETGKGTYNPVSSYRTHFTVPANWKGRDVILRFDGVYSAYYVWVNGKSVGYAEDSKLPSEFNITPYLVSGENVLAVEVYRWCDGSYLEDQDMTRYSGIFRDVTLWSMPKDGVWDFQVKTALDGTVEVTGDSGLSWRLYDAAFQPVDIPVQNVHLWSAEDPYLYTLVVRKGEDLRRVRIGFKSQAVVGHTFLVNGQPIKFKGVNRHETSPENGRAVSLQEMIADITLMKRYNIDTVRTSHYPNHRLWYDLCDKYGIYLVAEANVEAHEPGYGPEGFGKKLAWNDSIVERNARHVVDYRNHPSITMWSLGNETAHGVCFTNAANAVRGLDSTRPVHWERGSCVADVDSRMYPTVEWVEARGIFGMGEETKETRACEHESWGWNWPLPDAHHTKGKCAFLCEYAHAMGNAIGDFDDYWQIFYKYESLCGGCIWDWIDQAVWKNSDRVDPKTGKLERYLSYGGDFDEKPNDGPFNCNGVIGPTRQVTAKLIEVGHVHRNLVVTNAPAMPGNNFAVVFELWNRFLFTSADAFTGSWTLLADGVTVGEGAFEPPALGPLSRCRFMVPGLAEALARAPAGAELFVNFAFSLKNDCLWAEKGWTVARDQVRLSAETPDAFKRFVPESIAGGVRITQDAKTVTVLAGPVKAVFCRKSGTLCELVKDGITVLEDPVPGLVTGPQFTFARAFTDNDRWLRKAFLDSGLSQPNVHAKKIRIEGNEVHTAVRITGSKSAGFDYFATWQFAANGTITLKNRVVPFGVQPEALPRAGLSLRLARGFERMSYYGRGPRENYVDRKTASFFGLWRSTVSEQFEPYVRPQDNGYKCDVRWVEFANPNGAKIRFAASLPMFVQALHYSMNDLEFARHRNGQDAHRAPLVKRSETCLNLDIGQTGLGGGSCGPATQEKYRCHPQTFEWTLYID